MREKNRYEQNKLDRQTDVKCSSEANLVRFLNPSDNKLIFEVLTL